MSLITDSATARCSNTMETEALIPANTVVVPSSLLNGIDGVEGFFSRLARIPPAVRYVFDLEQAKFVEPCGVIALLSGIRQCFEISGNQVILKNIDETLYCYLERMSFFATAGKWIRPIGVPRDSWGRNPTTTNLLELTPIAGPDDVEAVVERARRIFAPWLSQDELGAMLSVLSELCSNVFEHSGDPFGSALIQKYYSERLNQIRICLSVGDAGRGIRASLVERHGQVRQEPIEYLHAALGGMTSRATGRGGTGLRRVLEIAAAHHGYVCLRSETAMILDRGLRGRTPKPNLAHVAGTQVSVELRSSVEG